MTPSTTELSYFLEIARCLSFSKASKKLGVTQPSLSMAIKRLEQTLGVELFVRHKTGVTLTRAGRHLSSHVSQLLDYWSHVQTSTIDTHREMQGRVVIGCHASMALHGGGFIPGLLKAHPKLEISFEHNVSHVITEQVINSQIDIGVVSSPFEHPDLIIKNLYDNEMALWTSKITHPVQDIHSNEAVIICDPNLVQTQVLLKKLKKLKFKRMITSSNLQLLARLTIDGAGIGLLPRCIIETISPNILQKVSGTPTYHDNVVLIYRKENRDVKIIKKIVDVIFGQKK